MLAIDDAMLRKEVFAWYGAAAYSAQCFEVELIILLLLVHRIHEPRCTPQELDRIDLHLSKHSLGQLLKELKAHFWMHPDFESLLDEYRRRRNYLAHRFFYENATKLSSRAGCDAMISELRAIYATMKEAHEVAKAMSARARNFLGISEEQVQRFVDEELAREAAN